MLSALARALLVAACATSVLAAPELPTRTTSNLSDKLHPVDVVTSPLPLKDTTPLTNGQRLARGLPLNPPRRRSRAARALQARQSSTCTTQTGIIEVSGGPGGYISATPTSFGEYQPTTDISQALVVSFCADTTVGTTLDLQTTNGISAYDYLGAIRGFADNGQDLSAVSANYYYLGGTGQVARGPPVESPNSFSAASGTSEQVESNIWALSSATNALAVSFVNPDGSVVVPTIVYVPSSNAFAITGSPALFSANFGTAEVVSFTFVPNAVVTGPF